MAIVRLRDLDVPLRLVHEVITARDPDTTRRVLARHEATMRDRLAETERILAALQDDPPRTASPAHSFATAHATTLECSATVPSDMLWDWLADSATRLAMIAAERGASLDLVGALYTHAILGDGFEDVTAFVAIDEPSLLDQPTLAGDGVRIGEIPARDWAALSHTGGFNTIGDTYRVLGAWVARNADAADAAICELYPNILDNADDSDIEIRWPLAPTAAARS